MTRTCTVCTHQAVEEINKQLISGVSYRDIARQHKVDKSALSRHKDSHITDALLKSEYDINATIEGDVKDIDAKIKAYLQQAYEEGDLRVSHLFVGDALKLIELKAKLSGQMDERAQINVNTQVNFIQTPEWIETRIKILNSLTPYPEAKRAMLDALRC